MNISRTQPPAVAMLWETHEPRDALLSRFGFDGADAAARWLAGVLAAEWGVTMRSCERVVISAGNALAWITTDAGPLIAKWSAVSKLHPRLTEVAALTAWLDDRGLPVSAPIASSRGVLQVEVDGVSMGLQTVVDGVHLDVDDRDQVHEAGVVLARLHLALADYPDGDRVAAQPKQRPATSAEPLVQRIVRWLDSMPLERRSRAAESLRESLAALGSKGTASLAVQLVHNDFRSANVLCNGGRITAVLDFEEVGLDHPVADLAGAAVLLGTRFRGWGPVSARTREVFVSGYRSVRALSEPEEAWLSALMLWRTLGHVPVGDDPAGWAGSADEQAFGHEGSRR
ncbi:phosphotransferase enzyme family protein [Actinopolymorpha pittospori]|uniref:Homoserine kinase type II n=1 Tax=Actinopolymorpha pittospori TaxID=648752 RepID=A0A927N152_9ACTN|nr:phosphotransferase [Actinopolymorpha pittospori]MBE1607032.1 homoserine kinase type II [Actinopolymorpha pittospori]